LGERTLKICVGNKEAVHSFISGNTQMGTRHLYWILTGPSFAVHLRLYSYLLDNAEVSGRGIQLRPGEVCTRGRGTSYTGGEGGGGWGGGFQVRKHLAMARQQCMKHISEVDKKTKKIKSVTVVTVLI
jgi:hypothetical protein